MSLLLTFTPKTYKMTRNYLLRGVLATALLLLTVGSTVVYGQSTSINCIPVVEHSDVARINALSIEGTNYVTHGSKGYHDWRHVVNIPFTAGTRYPIKMQPKYFKEEVTVYWKIWIDYNMDGDFDDLYEYTCYGKGKGAIQGKLNIPQDIWNGETTMRVAISSDHYPNIPCDYIESGEVEDYKVTISNGNQFLPKEMKRGGLCVHMPTKAGDDKSDKTLKEKEAKKSNSNLTVETRSKISDDQYELSIFPNPSINFTVLKLDLEGENQKVDNIQITDLQGRLMTKTTYSHLENSTYKIDTQVLSGGIYNVSAYIGDRVFSSKLIVTK